MSTHRSEAVPEGTVTKAYVCAGSSESVQGWLRDASMRLLEARVARGAAVRRARRLTRHR